MSNLQEDLRKALQSMYRGYDFPYDRINDLITKIGGAAAAENYAEFAKKFPNSANGEGEWLSQAFDLWRKNEIMRLMQAQQNEQLKIGRLINNARDEGVAFGNLVEAYTGDRARKHAVFEMRNAHANLNAVISKNRMQEAGIDCYKWRTGNDERVRPEHKEMEGEICRWDDPSVYYDGKTKTWVPRTGDMVHKHPGEDYNCRCTASPYLMEIDEETGKYAKGTGEPDEIEEILRGDETEIAERLAGEFDKKQFMEGLDDGQKQFFNRLLKEQSGWTADEANKYYAKDFMLALMARAQKEPELKKMLSSLRQFDKRFKGGFKFAFQVPKKGESPARYDGERTVYLNLVKWLSPQNRAGGSKTLFRSAFHEIMHASLGANPTFRKSYLNKMETAIMSEMKKGNEAGFKSFHNAKTVNDVRASLAEIWKPYVNTAKANGNEYWEASVSPFTDFTHSYMSKYLKAETIKKINMKKTFKAVDGVIINAHKQIGFHKTYYYTSQKESDKKYGSLGADEFAANAGSLFFTDRKLFNVYAKEMPAAFGAVEKLIANGGSPDINLYFINEEQ